MLKHEQNVLNIRQSVNTSRFPSFSIFLFLAWVTRTPDTACYLETKDPDNGLFVCLSHRWARFNASPHPYHLPNLMDGASSVSSYISSSLPASAFFSFAAVRQSDAAVWDTHMKHHLQPFRPLDRYVGAIGFVWARQSSLGVYLLLARRVCFTIPSFFCSLGGFAWVLLLWAGTFVLTEARDT